MSNCVFVFFCMKLSPWGGGGGGLVGRKCGEGNLAFQFGCQISHAKSRGFVLSPPIPFCFACSMSHSLFLACAKFPMAKFITAQLTRHQSPPPPPPGCLRR